MPLRRSDVVNTGDVVMASRLLPLFASNSGKGSVPGKSATPQDDGVALDTSNFHNRPW